MTPEEISVNTETYAARLYGLPKRRMDPARTFRSLSEQELLAHAHHLCDTVREHLHELVKTKSPATWGKVNRHYASLQMCMSFAGRDTLEYMMKMNKWGTTSEPGAS